ncbi:alpha/beta fold hydrolase [Blastomonas sp.]|uniref:alpha/beta fold hydrolase n=1 Tax=Blastomonas sp. TaxID=1909299 RepID=UPI00262F615B|nr:alpha/beta fold hydrolase [Blastomonas sp.]MDM7957650.1 alpha/beta fold hydrolase [Blastomonas sp.]
MSLQTFAGFGGLPIVARLWGDPHLPPVLLLHGIGQTHAAWADAAYALEQAGRHVIALDLRGHGESGRPVDGAYSFDAFVGDLRGVLAQLPARPVVVAASFGGWLAAVVLGEDGGHLASGLVLADAPPELDPQIARGIADGLRRRAADNAQAAVWDARILDTIDSEAVAIRVRDAASRLAVPTLFVRGSESRVTDAGAVESFVACIASAEFAQIEGAGHLAATDRTEAFNAVLLNFLERRVPLLPPEYREGTDPRTLRDALGCFATGVTIVTALADDGTPVGLTANSFTSVSLDPPLLLVCIARNAGSASVLEQADRFAVNVLQIGQQPASNRFASRTADRFGMTDWQLGEMGVPVLNGSLSTFECARHALHDGGDHIILVGRVIKATFEPRRDPLLYFRGKYRRLHFA